MFRCLPSVVGGNFYRAHKIKATESIFVCDSRIREGRLIIIAYARHIGINGLYQYIYIYEYKLYGGKKS